MRLSTVARRLLGPFKQPAGRTAIGYRATFDRTTLSDWILHHQRHIAFERCTWMGHRALKNPLDAWIYQEIIAETRPEVIVEIGSNEGGSTLYFAHLLDLLGNGVVVSVDINRSAFAVEHPRIITITGDSGAPEVVQRVTEICSGKAVMVNHDADHACLAVLRDLEIYAPLVGVGQYLIVEDGIVDIYPDHASMGHFDAGPLVALESFLPSHPEFECDRERERYLITYNPRGFLRRVR